MSLKRIPTDEEIDALADRFRALWILGDVIRPWLRRHGDMLLELVHGDWSWAALARALTKAEITYRTGKPWTAKWLQSDFYRAQTPLKGYAKRNKAVPASPHPAALALPYQEPASLNGRADRNVMGPESFAEDTMAKAEAEFQPAALIRWGNKPTDGEADAAAGAAPAARAPAQNFDEVMRKLTGKPPPHS